MSVSKQNVVDIIQWILIVGLSVMLLYGYLHTNKSNIANNEEYSKDNTYVRIYESQKIEKLKNENKQLYDSIKNLQNVESVIEVRYKYKYRTDTVYADKSLSEVQKTDSVYDFHSDNDTVNYNLKIKANELQWYTMDFTINDKFTIVNQNENNLNKTTVTHSDNVTIDGTTVYHKQDNINKWYNRFSVGPTIGVGVNQKGQFGTYVGVGITFNLLKK